MENVPQLEHTLSVFAVVVEYVFAEQFEHASFGKAAAVLNFPGTQATQVSVACEITPAYPATQAHDVTTLLPTKLVEFKGHGRDAAALVAFQRPQYRPVGNSVHACGPVCSLYEPGSHGKQEPPFEPVFFGQNPALHAQLWMLPLSGGDHEFDGQESH